MIRKIIFWTHLVAGILTGIVILTMSVTAVILTYEHQLITYAEKAFYSEEEGNRLTADDLILRAENEVPGGASLTFINDRRAPVYIQRGMSAPVLMNPYTGEIIGKGAVKTRAFFSWNRAFHRWFALEGESRSIGRSIIGVSNLIFVFIIISGLYLWLPSVWKWITIRPKILFLKSNPTSKARDYNWHHVLGFWFLIPLFIMASTALVFSYPWASDLVYRVYGEDPPSRGGGNNQEALSEQLMPENILTIEDLLQKSFNYNEHWNRITLSPPDEKSEIVNIRVDTGSGREPTKRVDLEFNRYTGDIEDVVTFSDATLGRRSRTYIRYLHTGESLGFIGQTIAGIGSLAACVLFYTGFALAYRRLIVPLFRRKKN